MDISIAPSLDRRVLPSSIALALAVSLVIGFMSFGPGSARASAATLQVPAFGVNYHATWGDYSDGQRATVVGNLAAAHTGWVRIDIGWQTIQEHGSSDYESWYLDIVDRAVNEASSHGIKVLGMLWRTPSWACGGCSNPYSPPSNPSSYAKFARWAAERWAGKVQAWEVWNEPNQDDFWTGSAQQYVNLLKAAYPAFKAGDPNTKVVIGGPAYNDTGWLSSMYRMGAKGSFDVMATHPYQGQANNPPETPDTNGDNIWLLSHVKAVHDLMAANDDGAKPIWFTEYGWSAHSNSGGEDPWDTGVTLTQQADYLVRSLEFVGQNYPYVTNVFWYNERDTDMGSKQQDGYGLMYRNLNAKPALTAVGTFLASADQNGGGSGGGGSGGGSTGPGSCTISGTSGADDLVGTSGPDVICSGDGDDVIHGRGGNDVIYAGAGNDSVYGGGGDDTIYGGGGNDSPHGGSGNDTLSSGDGNDVTGGGIGRDRIFGGAGADLLASVDHVTANDSVAGGAGADRCFTDRGDAESAC